MRTLLVLILLAVAFTSDAPGQYILNRRTAFQGTPFLAPITTGALRNDFDGLVGFKMHTGASPITITHLGRWVVAGNTGVHSVRILNSTPTLLVSVNVATVGVPTNTYAWTAITPITLPANLDYWVGSLEATGGDKWSVEIPVVSTAVSTVTFSAYDSQALSVWATGTNGTYAFGIPNFRYR